METIETKKELTILWLESEYYFNQWVNYISPVIDQMMSDHHILVEMIFERSLSPSYTDFYKLPDEIYLKKVRELTSSKKVDIIVVGNNRGVGLKKAAAIADINCLREEDVIIIWNEISKGVELPKYWMMGFSKFCSRGDALGDEIMKTAKDLFGLQ